MRITLDFGAYLPRRAYDDDAGYDLCAKDAVTIAPHETVTVDTGVHIELPPHSAGFIRARSSMQRRGLISSGTIDVGYTGSIGVSITNCSDLAAHFQPGDRIAQLVIVPIMQPALTVVERLADTERGSNGFGSTGV